MQRPQLLETRRIAKCYLNYINNHRDQVQPLFELLTVVNHKTRCDYTFVKDFFVDVVADQYTVSEKRQVGEFTLLGQFVRRSDAHCIALTAAGFKCPAELSAPFSSS